MPSKEGNSNKGGEWTFMSPLCQPLLIAAEDFAYHCFLQIQGPGSKHYHIHSVAISPLENVVAFLDSNGRMCLIPIESNTGNHGGFRSRRANSNAPPIEIETVLGQNDELRGDIKFNASGTKLYAITHSGAVEVTLYNSADNSPPDRPRLRSIAVSEFKL